MFDSGLPGSSVELLAHQRRTPQPAHGRRLQEGKHVNTGKGGPHGAQRAHKPLIKEYTSIILGIPRLFTVSSLLKGFWAPWVHHT